MNQGDKPGSKLARLIKGFGLNAPLVIISIVVVVISILRFSTHGFDYQPGVVPESEFCATDIGAEMGREGHIEDMLWRGCLVVSQTNKYLKRYVNENNVFALRDTSHRTEKSCLDCHDGKQAPLMSIMWTKFPRFNKEKGKLEDYAQAIQDELKLRYAGTLPERADVMISTIYVYSFAKAKMNELTFKVDDPDAPRISDEKLASLNTTGECLEIFEEKGYPAGLNAEHVVRGCNVVTDPHNNVPQAFKIWKTEMKCTSCHRKAGSLDYAGGLGYGAVILPYMHTGANKPIRFDRRTLMCFARSLNWLDFGRDASVLIYVRMYSNWLAEKDQLKIGIVYPERGIHMMTDTEGLGSSILAGEAVFKTYCQHCHGPNAWGHMGPVYNGKEPPPIAGPYSFNASASTSHRERLAGFVFHNMPPGASYDNPILTKQQALDVAVYLASLGRPTDFVHTNQVGTFLNYLWQNLIYHGFESVVEDMRNNQKEQVTMSQAEDEDRQEGKRL